MGIEFELKFAANEEALDAIRAVVPGEEAFFHMQTTYYDTPGNALSARKWTLRRRKENDQFVCTLKFPIGDHDRGEVEVPCNSIEEAIPELCKLSGMTELSALTKNGLVAVCGADFHRIAKTFTYDDTTMEMALDKGILTGGGKEIPLCELEVELKSGSRETATVYAMGLAKAFGLQEETKSKFRRALDLAKEKGNV